MFLFLMFSSYQVCHSCNFKVYVDFTFFSLTILQIGPLRCWPGGLCLSRSIGDLDVGEFIVPVPHVKQVKVSSPYEFVKSVQ
jgi:hypothetical protein